MKLKKKIRVAFLGLALLSIVAGFCDSFIESASASMHKMDAMVNFDSPDGQMHYLPSAILIHESKSKPSNNSLKPCCAGNYHDTTTIQTANFTAGIKLLPIGVDVSCPNLTSFFKNKLNTTSDSSPPKPDELSSVLRLE